jgi:acetoin utilization protein AcuB
MSMERSGMAKQIQKVRDIMTTDVVTISMDETLLAAQSIFHERRFHHLIVVDNGRPTGVISDRDLLKNLSPFVGTRMAERSQDVETLKKRIHQFMTRQLIAIDPDAMVNEAARVMINHRVSCLPVIEAGGNLVGIITMRDLVRWVVIDSANE